MTTSSRKALTPKSDPWRVVASRSARTEQPEQPRSIFSVPSGHIQAVPKATDGADNLLVLSADEHARVLAYARTRVPVLRKETELNIAALRELARG